MKRLSSAYFSPRVTAPLFYLVAACLMLTTGCASRTSSHALTADTTTTTWVSGTTITGLPEADGEHEEVTGSWTDSNCTSGSGNAQCGVGLTYIDYSFPSSHVGCPDDYSDLYDYVSYSPAGDAHYDEFAWGVQSASYSSSKATYSYKNRLHGKKCCKEYIDGIESSRDTSCDFDTAVRAASLTNKDSTVYLVYVPEMTKSGDSGDHYVDYTYKVTFPDEVFAAIPVLSGMTNGLKNDAKIKEWKTILSSDGYVSPTTEVTFSGEIYLHGDGEKLDSSDSKIGATLIGLPESIPDNVQSAGGRLPVVAVFRVPNSGDATCRGIYGSGTTSDPSSAPYQCNDDNSNDDNSPNFSASGAEITLTVTDLASNQKISNASVFVQSANLEFNDQHDLKHLKLKSGANSSAKVTIGSVSCGTDGCSQSVTFTPSFSMTDNSGHDTNSDSYLDVVLLVLFEYEEES